MIQPIGNSDHAGGIGSMMQPPLTTLAMENSLSGAEVFPAQKSGRARVRAAGENIPSPASLLAGAMVIPKSPRSGEISEA